MAAVEDGVCAEGEDERWGNRVVGVTGDLRVSKYRADVRGNWTYTRA